jgi:hypothetical protein
LPISARAKRRADVQQTVLDVGLGFADDLVGLFLAVSSSTSVTVAPNLIAPRQLGGIDHLGQRQHRPQAP